MRPRRSPARWLAPIALVACALAVYSIVNATLSDAPAGSPSSSSRSSIATTATSRTASQRAKGSKRRRRPRTYTVKAGDTLSAISLKTGVSIQRLQQLNPALDSQALQTGQHVKLSP